MKSPYDSASLALQSSERRRADSEFAHARIRAVEEAQAVSAAGLIVMDAMLRMAYRAMEGATK